MRLAVRQRADLHHLTPVRTPAARDAGSTSLEAAFVAPALLLLVLTTVQAGLWFHGRSVALQVAREGVSQWRLADSEAEAAELRPLVDARVLHYAAAVGRESLLEPAVVSAWELRPDGDARAEVVVTGAVVSLVPGLHLSTTQRAVGEVERFQRAAW